MALFGHIVMWGLAALGALTIIGIVIAGFDQAKASKTPSVEATRPPAQIVNLREIPRADVHDERDVNESTGWRRGLERRLRGRGWVARVGVKWWVRGEIF